MKLNKKRVALAIGALTAFLTVTATTIILLTNPDLQWASASVADRQIFKAPTMKYGFVLDSFLVEEDVLKPNKVLSEYLSEYHITSKQIDELSKIAADVMPTNKLVAGKDYMLLADRKTGTAKYFIYEPSPYYYVVYDLSANMRAYKVERKVDLKEKTVTGVVESSLWDALVKNDFDYMLAVKMEEALKYSVDFFHVKKGDKFKLLYTEKYVDGKAVGIGDLLAAYANFDGEESYAFFFKDEAHNFEGYFDEMARPMKKAFLKAPVEFARISSPFNMKRFHPILRIVRPHLGTDFAAPYGAPIIAVADGVVQEATRKGGNGIYVKIKHDDVYSSQYLHMSKHAKGITPGVHVSQGQVIGYVGATGLATGPHVCFRFWKNGQQVDFLKEKLPRPEPMTGEYVERFYQLRDSLRTILDALPFNQDGSTATVAIDSIP